LSLARNSNYRWTSEIIVADHLIGKSQNTTVPTMRKAKALITRGLLTRGTERKGIGYDKELIAGTYRQRDNGTVCRIFAVENNDKTTLIWQGDSSQFRSNYMRIRDDWAGKVPYRLHGKAAIKAHEDHITILNPSHNAPKNTANKAAVQREMPAISVRVHASGVSPRYQEVGRLRILPGDGERP